MPSRRGCFHTCSKRIGNLKGVLGLILGRPYLCEYLDCQKVPYRLEPACNRNICCAGTCHDILIAEYVQWTSRLAFITGHSRAVV